jgi:hypothetical protein
MTSGHPNTPSSWLIYLTISRKGDWEDVKTGWALKAKQDFDSSEGNQEFPTEGTARYLTQ